MIRMFGFWRSLASYRVRVALGLKGLAFEEVSINLLEGQQLSEAFASLSPHRKVPVLEIDGLRLSQSLAILEYLEETRPEVPLLPAAPPERAWARELALVTIADAHPLIVPRVRRFVEAQKAAISAEDWARHWLREGLATYEALLTRRPPQPFALGDRVSLADIGIASHAVGAELFEIPLEEFATVRALALQLRSLEAFASAHPKAVRP